LSARPEWKSLQEQMHAAESQKKARSPRASFGAFQRKLGAAWHGASSVIPTYTYSGTMSVPLFTAAGYERKTCELIWTFRKLQQQQSDLRNQIALDVKTR